MNKTDLHKSLQTRIALDNMTKLGKIPNISLTPVKGCLNCSKCKEYCYAQQAYIQYKQTRIAWDKNLWLVKNDMDTFEKDIKSFLTVFKPKTFRLHVSGDFITQEYVNMWYNVIRQYPDVKFFTYTKSYTKLSFGHKPDNLALYFSIEPDSPLPKHIPKNVKRAFIEGDKRISKDAVKCPATFGSDIKCDECKKCLIVQNDIIFKMH